MVTMVNTPFEDIAIMATSQDIRFKQRAVIEFLTAESCSPVDIHQRMKLVYGESCVDYTTVWRWAKSLKGEDPIETKLHDERRCGRPKTASNAINKTAVGNMILANRRVKQSDIAREAGISKERVQHIITDILGYRKVSSRWVPRMLTPEMKKRRKTICSELLRRYEEEGNAFIQQIVTGDESWVHHYDPESKRQSMEYRHKNSPCPRKFKVVASARKVLLTIFWDCEGEFHIEFLKQGKTVNSD